jgi:hypothetical protein
MIFRQRWRIPRRDGAGGRPDFARALDKTLRSGELFITNHQARLRLAPEIRTKGRWLTTCFSPWHMHRGNPGSRRRVERSLCAVALAIATFGIGDLRLNARELPPQQMASNVLGGSDPFANIPEVAALTLLGTGLILVARSARRRGRTEP